MNERKRNRIEGCNLLLGIVLLLACEPQARADQRGQRYAVDVILTVNNQSRRAVQISLKSDALEQVLGNVASGASRPFSVPSALVGSLSMLRLEAVGDGGMAVRSEGFGLRRGQKVVWTFVDTGHGTMDMK